MTVSGSPAAGPATGPETVDVIVVGGGLSGGLPAAAYLQKAGLQVLIVEANAELGSFCCTHETWPQTLDSPHVGVSFAGNSPVIADLELERYGFRFAASPVVLATTYRDGTNCLICQDPERTADNFARHSDRDGQRMLEIQSRVHETMVEFNELSSFSPHPDPSRLPQVFELCAYAMDYPVEQMMEMTGPELCERTFESDACRQILMTPVAFWEHGAPFARGQGAFGTTFALYYVMMSQLVRDWDGSVLDYYDWTPLDNWRLNRSARFGQVVGGDFTEDQWILGRMPYRMPVGGLYMSNGVWPVGLSWMAAGYNAAQIVAADAGVRDQPWWAARPCEWYEHNLPRLLAYDTAVDFAG